MEEKMNIEELKFFIIKNWAQEVLRSTGHALMDYQFHTKKLMV